MTVPELLKLSGFPLSKIWGGDFLARYKKMEGQKVGEIWELSTLLEGPSSYQGRSLIELAKGRENDFWGEKGRLESLIKFIDTSEHLSIQVHPDDEYAKRIEDSLGKSECWLIVHAEPGAGIYLGFKEGVQKDKFRKMLIREESILSSLNFFPVLPGDFYYVPAGTIHAIGKGICLLEIQQSSGVTYRVWDWNRKDENGRPRELHVEKSLDVLNFGNAFNRKVESYKKSNVFTSTVLSLLEHPQFNVSSFSMQKEDGHTFCLGKGSRRARALVCTKGRVEIERGKERVVMESFETVLLPYRGAMQLKITSQEYSHLVWLD